MNQNNEFLWCYGDKKRYNAARQSKKQAMCVCRETLVTFPVFHSITVLTIMLFSTDQDGI